MTPPQIQTAATKLHGWNWLPRPLKGALGFLSGALCAAFITAICAAMYGWLPEHGVSMFYILAVVTSAVAFGMLSGIAAATVSFLAYNYFFLQPTYTFTISDTRDLVTLLVFFAVALTTGSLAGRLRELAEQARQRAKSLEAMNSLGNRLSAAASSEEMTNALILEASKISGQPAIILHGSATGLTEPLQRPDSQPLSTADWQAAQRCATSRETIYPVAPGWQGSHYEFRPLVVQDRVFAVLGVRQLSFDKLNDSAICSMVQQAAAALERLSAETAKAEAEKQVEGERLRSALLSSVSHDIKTPLAAIQGAVTSLRQLGSKLSEESKCELLATIDEETVQLTRFVTNMLDMMRLQSGPPDVGKSCVDLADTLASAVMHARKLFSSATFNLDIRVAPALVWGDEILLEHVFFNVLENAANASPQGAEIKVVLSAAGNNAYSIEIEDGGEGIDPQILPRIFEKFYRAPGTKSRGSGLGLAICREVLAALGGRMTAESPANNGRGTRMTLTFVRSASLKVLP